MRIGSQLVVAVMCLSSRLVLAQEPPPPTQEMQAPPPVAEPVPQPVAQPVVVAQPEPAPLVYMAAPDESPAKNSIYVEGLGAGLAYSFNYERLVVEQLAVRVGFSYMSYGATATSGTSTASSSTAYLTFPITASYIGVRGGKHSLEMGGGMTLVYASGSASAMGVSATGSGAAPLGILMIGYRLHPVGRAGFQFRVGAMALVGKGLSLSDPDPEAIGALPWAYLSLGASFG